MQISERDWLRYINKLAEVNQAAAEQMQKFVSVNGFDDTDALIAYANALTTKYGEAAAALTCDMYDAIARAQGASVPSAIPAKTPSLEETANVINSALERAPITVPDETAKLVKKTSTRTMKKNAIRDGAWVALIPSGDGCAFCKMLASRGWEPARSSKSFEKHLHKNCQCEYVVRFGDDLEVEGYDPDALYDEFMQFDGSWDDKMNAMRRDYRAEHKDEINAQKRMAYAKRNLAELRKNRDPIFDIYGPISKSHPEEARRIRESAAEKGVEIIDGNERMAYSPGLRKGQPGQLIISENDSIGAWLHEEQHMLDDEKDGFLGFEGLFDIDRRCTMEYNAYRREIEIARAAGREDIVKKLIVLCKNEIKAIGGVWDAKRLK